MTHRPKIGILMLDTVFPRIPGDVGNMATFPFPVRYLCVPGATAQRVVKEADARLLPDFMEAARILEQEGVKAIATSCGFLALFQRELAEAVSVPFLTSSLLQVPFARAIIGRNKRVGILTACARFLTDRHFAALGIDSRPLVVRGMEEAEEFTSAFIEGKVSFDPRKVRDEMVRAAQNFVSEHPEIGAMVLECTNMPPYAKALYDALQMPIFDVVTLIRHLHGSLERTEF